MAIQAGVGYSTSGDSQHAGYEACTRAMEQGGITKPSAVIVFASVFFEPKKVSVGINEATGGVPVFGCSSSGEIINDLSKSKTVAVMVIASDTISFAAAAAEGPNPDGFMLGQKIAKLVKEVAGETPLKAMLMLTDSLTMNGGDAVRGAVEGMGPNVPIIGGAAGDDFQFIKTFQYVNSGTYSGSIAGMGLGGEGLALGLGARHGWMPIGLPMEVTRANGPVLYEVSGRPAVSVYEEYFEKKAEDLRKQPLAQVAITYPLGIKIEGRDEYLLRDPLTVGEDGSITCSAEIPEGSKIRLMIGSRDRAIDAAKYAAERLMDDFKAQTASPKAVIAFNCIAREKLYSGRANEEIAEVRRIIGMDVPLIGFYTYGEIGPLDGGLSGETISPSAFFSETIVLFGIGE